MVGVSPRRSFAHNIKPPAIVHLAAVNSGSSWHALAFE